MVFEARTSERRRGCFWGCLVSPKYKTAGLTFHQSFQPLEKVARTTGGFCHKSPVNPEGEGKLGCLCLHPGKKLKVKQTRQSQHHPWSACALRGVDEAGGEDMGGTQGNEGREEEKRKEENTSETGEQMRERAEFCKRIVVEPSHAHPDPALLAFWDLPDPWRGDPSQLSGGSL